MKKVEVTFGQTGVDKEGKLIFPPENAKKIETPENYIEIDLIEDSKNRGKDR